MLPSDRKTPSLGVSTGFILSHAVFNMVSKLGWLEVARKLEIMRGLRQGVGRSSSNL